MIVPERPMMFYKSRLFFWAFLGASRTTEIFKSNGFIGFVAPNITAYQAVIRKKYRTIP